MLGLLEYFSLFLKAGSWLGAVVAYFYMFSFAVLAEFWVELVLLKLINVIFTS